MPRSHPVARFQFDAESVGCPFVARCPKASDLCKKACRKSRKWNRSLYPLPPRGLSTEAWRALKTLQSKLECHPRLYPATNGYASVSQATRDKVQAAMDVWVTYRMPQRRLYRQNGPTLWGWSSRSWTVHFMGQFCLQLLEILENARNICSLHVDTGIAGKPNRSST